MGFNTAISLLGGLILTIILGGYFGQPFLPKPKPKIIGLDLGTTYSSVAVFQPGLGTARVIPVQNSLSVPSVLAVNDGHVLIGYPAMRQIKSNSEFTYYDAKRFIGKTISLAEFESVKKRYPFIISRQNETVVFKLPHPMKYFDNQLYLTPERMTSEIISLLKTAVHDNISSYTSINKAVIAVPAEFNTKQRNATISAAHLSGLEVLSVISEPTAAALAYGIDKQPGFLNLVVVDLGGGTLDVSLLRKMNAMFYTMAIAGNNHLGGQDFTELLSELLIEKIGEEYQLDVEFIQEVKREAERIKLELTSKKISHFHKNSKFGIKDVIIYRHEFEEINEHLFSKIIEPIKLVLDFAKMNISEIDEVILVGGSTRIPRVRQIISEYFSGKQLDTSIDPELAVVQGVAIHSGVVSSSWPLRVAVLDVPTSVKKIDIN